MRLYDALARDGSVFTSIIFGVYNCVRSKFQLPETRDQTPHQDHGVHHIGICGFYFCTAAPNQNPCVFAFR